MRELQSTFAAKWKAGAYHTNHIRNLDVVGTVCERLEELAAQNQLEHMEKEVFAKYKAVFEPIPHVDDLPTDIWCRINIKDASKTIMMRTYSSPHKYHEAWRTLLQSHESTSHIWPSNSAHASPSFLIPKSDTTVLPWWVNDYWVLNSNTVLDSYPLPQVDDILADCAKGHIWSCLDMTNSFFQTQVHPDDVHLTAITTPFGLYEWTVMPQGLKNVPLIHQCWMNSTLCHLIRKICHIYLDDIVIWSSTIADHIKHIDMVMKALTDARLFCNKKKCNFFSTELNFLRHHISAWGLNPTRQKFKRSLIGQHLLLRPMSMLSWALSIILLHSCQNWLTIPMSWHLLWRRMLNLTSPGLKNIRLLLMTLKPSLSAPTVWLS